MSDPVEAAFVEIDALSQRYYTGAIIRWREYREGVFAAIRAALSPEAAKPALAACCQGLSPECQRAGRCIQDQGAHPVDQRVSRPESEVAKPAEAATYASWCGTVHPRGGTAARFCINHLDDVCFCTIGCKLAGRPLHPATEQAATPRRRHVGPKNFAGSCGACMLPWDDPPMYPPCESPFNRAEQEGGNR